MTLAAALLAVGTTRSLPTGLARLLKYLLGPDRERPRLEAFIDAMAATGRTNAAVPASVPGWAVVTAIGCGLVSTAAVLGGGVLTDVLARRLLWTPLSWTIVKVVVQWMGFLPMATGFWAVFQAMDLLGSNVPPDAGAERFRDRLWSLAAGAGVFGVLFWWGLNLLGLAAMAVLGLFLAALVLFQRRAVDVAGRGRAEGVDRTHPGRFGVFTGAAALTVILLIQVRLVGELAGLGSGLRGVCLAGALAMVGLFVWLADRRKELGRESQATGASVGVFAIAIAQVALLIGSLQGGPAAIGCALMAAGCQVPLVALAAFVISRRRRMFAACGIAVGGYVRTAALGAGVGVLVYAVAASLPAASVVLLLMAMAVCAIRIGEASGDLVEDWRRGHEWLWGFWTVVLILGVSVGVFGAIRSVRQRVGLMTPGFWLTSVRIGQGPAEREVGCLPVLRPWRSERLTQALKKFMAGPKDPKFETLGQFGRWWVTRGCRDDFPSSVPNRVSVVASAADPAAVPPMAPSRAAATTAPASGPRALLNPRDVAAVPAGIWREALIVGSERDFLQAAHTGAALERYDVVFLSPLPADHPDAWRCYNYQVLRRCRRRVHRRWRDEQSQRYHPGGLVIVRTQAGSNDLAAVLAVAKTFHEAVGPSWLMVEFGTGSVDVLLVGPSRWERWPPWREGLLVVPTEAVHAAWPQIGAIRLVSPGQRWPRRTPSPGRLRYWMRQHAVK